MSLVSHPSLTGLLLFLHVTDNQPISVLRESDPLYCVELPAAKEPCEEDGAFILLCWINVLVEEHSQTRFGSPYTMQVARETSFEDLQKLLLKEMASIVDHRVLCQKQEVSLVLLLSCLQLELLVTIDLCS